MDGNEQDLEVGRQAGSWVRLLVSCLSVQDPGKEARERCSVDSMTIIGFDCSIPGNFPIWACYGSKESLGYTFHVIRRLSIFRGSLSCLRNGDIGDGGSWREPRSTPRRPRLFFFFFLPTVPGRDLCLHNSQGWSGPVLRCGPAKEPIEEHGEEGDNQDGTRTIHTYLLGPGLSVNDLYPCRDGPGYRPDDPPIRHLCRCPGLCSRENVKQTNHAGTR